MKRFILLLLISLGLITFNQSCKEPPVEAEPGAINGFVKDKDSGEPIENVEVLLMPIDKIVTTKSDGYFEFKDLEVGDYSLAASKTGYKDYIDENTVSVKSLEIISRDVVMERLQVSLVLVDDEGDEMNELDFGNLNTDVKRSFNILNNGEATLSYKIDNTASWVVDVTESEGVLQPDSLTKVEVTIDRDKLSIGENTASLRITSDEIEMVLSVKAYKSVNIITLDAADITTNSAVLRGSINLDGKSITEKGFVVYTDENSVTEYDVAGNEIGEFSCQISELEDGAVYYYKAYMIVADETFYGEEKSFTTLEEIVITIPEVVTVSVTEVTENTAILTGEVVSDGGAEVVERGFIWNDHYDGEGSIEDFIVEVGSGVGVFTYQLTGLQQNTEYYFLAYAINSEGEALGQNIYFTTLEGEEDNIINGYEYVDLGLPSGLKWAVHNVGASAAEDYGDYYAWGEIETKDSYTQQNSVTYGMPMEDISGDPQYDVARALWGETWRLPTRDEQKELLDNCTWEWTSQNGVNGYLVTGSNGNSIFLPAAGYKENSSHTEVGEYGYYWSSTPQSNSNLGAYYLYMSESSKLSYYYARVAGQSVRAVSE
ncbi:MAG: carboxypeptidase regulatory-like domain-containing protein [Bacteroidales bacterium]|nr:carboxypeptidase regulatory-like domain-containing protein [Bacteroidales bacterium]